LYDVKQSLQKSSYQADELSDNFCFCGHTHVGGTAAINNTFFRNPGSWKSPRNSIEKTYTILELEKTNLNRIVYNDEVIEVEENDLYISNNIRNLIDIQDTNIFYEDNCVKKGQFKGIQCKYVTGKLTYDPTHCENCGIKNIDYLVYKNGTEPSRITIPISGIT